MARFLRTAQFQRVSLPRVIGLLLLVVFSGACQHESFIVCPAPPPGKHIQSYHVGDVVTITFVTEPIPPLEEGVKEDGTITLPLLGDISVEGKTPLAVQNQLNQEYRNWKYYSKDPVRIGEVRYFFVRGEVNVPKQYPYTGGITVSKAIAAAGDFTEKANRQKAKIIRSNGHKETVRGFMRTEGPDPLIYPGDQIIVPSK
jgi:polysaccharide export outer membrane protein